MAEKTAKITLTQLSRDFSMKTKEITDFLKTVGMEKKSGASLEPDEISVFLDAITKQNQIENVDDYLDGKAKLTVEKPKAEEKAPVKEKEAATAEKKEAAETPKANEKAPVTEEKEKAAPSIATVKPAETPAPASEEKTAPATPAQATAPKAAAPAGTTTAAPRQQQPQNNRPAYQQNPQNNRFSQNGGFRQNANGQYPQTNRPFGQNQNRDQRPYDRNQPNSRPFDRNQGQGRPFGQNTNGQRPLDRNADNRVNPAQRPAFTQTPIPQKTVLPPQPKMTSSAPSAAAKKLEHKQEKKQKQEFKTIIPTAGMSAESTGEYVAAPTVKTRVIDTRTTMVDLSKYDDKVYNYVPSSHAADNAVSRQKLKKQDNRNQQNGQKSQKEKERLAQERIKRMEMEKARKKQLEITIPDEIMVSELAVRLKKTAGEVVKKLFAMGVMASINQTIDYDTAYLVADEFGAKATKEVVVTIEERLFDDSEDKAEDLVERGPVVCVMGHVDHGKTSLLDAIRHTSVTKGEAGGITQHIGAYRVSVNGRDITFLDTPGHEAFTAMRARGAQATDIAILVVAADDGIMPQTVEAINHAKAAGIDIIVAINKMDKPGANPDQIMQQLTQYDLVPEAWGGDVICVPVSALTGKGIPELLENVLLVADMKELKANPNRRAKGLVIESKLDRGRGPVATILVQNGTLNAGDIVIAGTAVGRVRAMTNDKGKNVKTAGPGVPVEIIGLDAVPSSGDEFNAVEDEKMARSLAEQRREAAKQEMFKANARASLDDLFSQMAEGMKTLNIIVKADVMGSAEAVKQSLMKLTNEEVKIAVIHAAVGGITESDVMLAAASNAIIVGFNVRPDKNAIDTAERQGVEIRTYRVIYDCIEEMKAAMKGMLAPKFKEVVIGHAQVRQTIRVPNVGTIAGSYVQDGKISRNASIRILRDGIVIAEDKIASLRRFKDDVKEVAQNYECGVGLDKFNDIKEGDIFEAYVMEEIK